MIETNADQAAEQARQAAERARILAERFRDALPVFRQISVMLDAWTKRNFQGQGKLVGGWMPFKYGGRIAPKEPGKRGGVYAKRGGKRPPAANSSTTVSTGKITAKKFEGEYVLSEGHRRLYTNTNAMLLQDTGALRMSVLPFASQTEAGIGTNLPYSRNHEEGIGVAKRRILPTQDEVGPKAHEIFERWMIVETKKLFIGLGK